MLKPEKKALFFLHNYKQNFFLNAHFTPLATRDEAFEKISSILAFFSQMKPQFISFIRFLILLFSTSRVFGLNYLFTHVVGSAIVGDSRREIDELSSNSI